MFQQNESVISSRQMIIIVRWAIKSLEVIKITRKIRFKEVFLWAKVYQQALVPSHLIICEVFPWRILHNEDPKGTPIALQCQKIIEKSPKETKLKTCLSLSNFFLREMKIQVCFSSQKISLFCFDVDFSINLSLLVWRSN